MGLIHVTTTLRTREKARKKYAVTSGRVIFGPDNAEPLLGVTASESVGILVDPTTRTLKRMPTIPLK